MPDTNHDRSDETNPNQDAGNFATNGFNGLGMKEVNDS